MFTTLPVEIILQILAHLDPLSLAKLSGVSTKLRHNVTKSADSIWRNLAMKFRKIEYAYFERKKTGCEDDLNFENIDPAAALGNSESIQALQESMFMIPASFSGLRNASTLGTLCLPACDDDDSRQLRDWKDVFKYYYVQERDGNRGKCTIRTLNGFFGSSGLMQFTDQKTISGLLDGSVIIWETSSGKMLARIKGHHCPITCLAAHSGLIASGGTDGRVIIYDAFDYQIRFELIIMGMDAISTIRFSTSHVIAGDRNGVIGVWSLLTGESVDRFLASTAVVRAPTQGVGVLTLQFDERFVIAAYQDTSVKVWSRKQGRLLHTLRDFDNVVNSIHFDGKYCCLGALDGSVKVFDLTRGVFLPPWDKEFPNNGIIWQGHNSGVTCVQIYKNFVLSGSMDKTITVWDRDGQQVSVLKGHTAPLIGIEIIPKGDGFQVLSIALDGNLKLWEGETCIKSESSVEGSLLALLTWTEGN